MRTHESAEGLWDALHAAEIVAVRQLEKRLSSFEPSIAACFEAGVQVPTLPTRSPHPVHLRFAALFLKRALTDLRNVWLSLRMGYTSAAAAVAAALWENALAAACLAQGGQIVSDLESAPSGDLPRSPQDLAKEWTQHLDDPDAHWLHLYGGYKWLCKIKHPTLRAGVHESGSAVTDDGDFVVMAAPDLRESDSPVKAAILAISLTRVRDAIASFAEALDIDPGTAGYAVFRRLLSTIDDNLDPYRQGLGAGLPFHVADDKTSAEYRRFRLEQMARRADQSTTPNDV